MSIKNNDIQVDMSILVAARDSKLSQAQVEEVYWELLLHHPSIKFSPIFIKTTGDLDKTTSLRTLPSTDFFTKEIDELLLNDRCDVAIHSAKDMPEIMHPDLETIAMTKGVDRRDALVFLKPLKKQSIIATSSFRREENVRNHFPEAKFVDIRGTVDERLEKLYRGEIDGVVVAEAALIRLKLCHLNRLILEGDTHPLQGRLAVVAKKGNVNMKTLFSPLQS